MLTSIGMLDAGRLQRGDHSLDKRREFFDLGLDLEAVDPDMRYIAQLIEQSGHTADLLLDDIQPLRGRMALVELARARRASKPA